MSRSYDIDHTGPDAKRALRAIIARIDGVFDDPDLMSFGALSTNTTLDIKRIAESVDTEEEEEEDDVLS